MDVTVANRSLAALIRRQTGTVGWATVLGVTNRSLAAMVSVTRAATRWRAPLAFLALAHDWT